MRIGNDWVSVVSDASLSVSDNELDNFFKTYPNPVKDYIFVDSKTDTKISSVTIYDALGKEIYSQQEFETNNRINVSQLNRGIYFMEIKADTKSTVMKIILD